MLLEPMLGEDAVWYAMLGLPAIYGALTIFPIATIAKDHFGKSAGVVAAWLIAFMPAHVSHSTWALQTTMHLLCCSIVRIHVLDESSQIFWF